jgi:hypothetical protein
MSRYSMCSQICSMKNDRLLLCVKIKNLMLKMALYEIFFCLFYTSDKEYRFFHKTWRVNAKFLFNFVHFKILFSYVELNFSMALVVTVNTKGMFVCSKR